MFGLGSAAAGLLDQIEPLRRPKHSQGLEALAARVKLAGKRLQ